MDPGARVDGRFEIEQRVASGGMGTVHRARDLATGDLVALKIVREPGDDAWRRVQREAKALTAIAHPRVVRCVAHGMLDTGEPWLAMEWVGGETLAERIGRAPLTTSEAVEVARFVAEALSCVHARGFVHRDIKPANIVLRGGRVDGVTLVDFDLVRQPDDTTFRTGAIMGTPAYMSPEQARGGHDVGPATDVFALGAVLFRCVTGRSAFEGTDALAVLAKVLLDTPLRARDLVPELDARLDLVIAKMLEKEVADRYADGDAASGALVELGTIANATPGRAEEKRRFGAVERKVETVVLAATDFDPDATQARDGGGGLVAVRKVVERIGGARCSVLATGAVVVTILPGDSAKEQAAKGAACAQAIARLVSVSVAVATGYDAYDRAAQLTRAASANEIAVDETTAALLSERWVVERGAGSLVLRGAAPAHDTGRTLLGKTSAFVGRERELVTLEAVFDECVREPAARAVLVTGPPGIGKSRLRRELFARLQAKDRAFLPIVGAADPFARAPFVMMSRALSGVVGAPASQDARARAEKLAARVEDIVHADDAERVADFLAEMCALDAPIPSSRRVAARADPVLMHEQIRRAFCDYLAAECARQPVILVLEDLHWADSMSLRLASAALSALFDQPLLVLAIARPEIKDTAPDLWAEHEVLPLPLGALSRRAAMAFARSALGADSTDEAIERVVERAGGNALYLEELVRAEHAGQGASPPDTVIAMVQSRLSLLDEGPRRTLRAASIFAGAFSAEGVSAVLADENPQAVAARLEHLVRIEFLSRGRAEQEHGGDFSFRHALVRDAAYGMLDGKDARLGHELAARFLERRGADPVAVAEHFARSDDPSRAAEPLLRAAQAALDASDFRSAKELASRAASADASCAGACAAVEAEARRWLGETALAYDAAGRALAALPRVDDAARFSALRTRAYGASQLGRLDELDEVAREILSSSPGESARAYAFAVSQAAASLAVVGSLELAERLLAVAQPSLDRFQRDPAVIARFLEAKVAFAAHAGNLEQLLVTAEAARSNAELAGDERAEIVETINTGFALVQLGAYEEALSAFDRARADSERRGLVTNRRSAMQNAGYVLLRLNRLNEARDLEQAVLAEIGDGSSKRLVTLAHACLALVEIDAGNLELAEQHARTAKDAATGPPQAAYADTALACVLLARERSEEAASHAEQALATMKRIGGFHFAEAMALLVRALARRTPEAIAEAESRLQARAAKLSPMRRAQFLSRVVENRRTLELAQNDPPSDKP